MIAIGVGLPTRLSGAPADMVVDWARRADVGPFSCVAVTDRVVIDALEPLSVLALAAGVTRRVRLVAGVVIGPTRETTLLARQTATIDALSGGRRTLGLGVGARPDDHEVTGGDFHRRGAAFDRQLPRLRAIWRREAPGAARIGPQPATPEGPELLIGGYVDATARRIAAWGDGHLAPGGGEPAAVARLWERIVAAWSEAGRTGRPRFVGGSYMALGPGAEEAARAYVLDGYGHDPDLAERRLRGVPITPDAVRARIAWAADLGMDEFILRPCAADPDQLDRLADVVAGV